MAKKNLKAEQQNEAVISYTVAECKEFHSIGEYHEGIRTLEEAVSIYRRIPPERMHGIPAVGISLHVKGTEKWQDFQADILSGDEIDIGMVRLLPELGDHPQVWKAVEEIIEKFPEKKVVDF